MRTAASRARPGRGVSLHGAAGYARAVGCPPAPRPASRDASYHVSHRVVSCRGPPCAQVALGPSLGSLARRRSAFASRPAARREPPLQETSSRASCPRGHHALAGIIMMIMLSRASCSRGHHAPWTSGSPGHRARVLVGDDGDDGDDGDPDGDGGDPDGLHARRGGARQRRPRHALSAAGPRSPSDHERPRRTTSPSDATLAKSLLDWQRAHELRRIKKKKKANKKQNGTEEKSLSVCLTETPFRKNGSSMERNSSVESPTEGLHRGRGS